MLPLVSNSADSVMQLQLGDGFFCEYRDLPTLQLRLVSCHCCSYVLLVIIDAFLSLLLTIQ